MKEKLLTKLLSVGKQAWNEEDPDTKENFNNKFTNWFWENYIPLIIDNYDDTDLDCKSFDTYVDWLLNIS